MKTKPYFWRITWKMMTNLNNFNFKPIEKYGGEYLASDCGRIFSEKNNMFMKLTITRKGYASVRLWHDGKGHTQLVHRLILEAFVGPSDKQVNHIDGNKLNNNLNNLEYVTNQQNRDHAHKNDLISCKIKPSQHGEVVELYKTTTAKDTAEMYGVSYASITYILRKYLSKEERERMRAKRIREAKNANKHA